ncbi:MAG TPA: hypothetical protein VH249_24265 [Xanthobacteraceae bacterium]|jgi:hypothetical protein|nr:hypothetical protein [Xanthobacteraceae bacterium]
MMGKVAGRDFARLFSRACACPTAAGGIKIFAAPRRPRLGLYIGKLELDRSGDVPDHELCLT